MSNRIQMAPVEASELLSTMNADEGQGVLAQGGFPLLVWIPCGPADMSRPITLQTD